jgi:uncharacterized protein (TIGR02118 family)
MIKSLTLLKKKAGLTREEFLRHWKEIHGPLAAKMIPERRKYMQCHPIGIPGVELEIDGIAEFWWDDLKSYQNYITWRKSKEAKVLVEDEKKFIDMSTMVRVFVEEKVIVEGESLIMKSFHMLKRKAGLTREEFLRYWKDKHGPLEAKMVTGRRKYVQCHPISAKVHGVEFEMDGVAEFWWDDLRSYQNYLTWRHSDDAKVLIEDEEKFIDMSQTSSFLGEEKVIRES